MTELDTHIKRLKALSYHPSIQQWEVDAIDAVLEALETAQKDSIRLDWMENHSLIAPARVNRYAAGQLFQVWARYGGGAFNSLRDAIDAELA